MPKKLRNQLQQKLVFLLQWFRIAIYRILSANCPTEDKAKRIQAVMLQGKGNIHLGRCQLGYWPSPYFFSGSIYIEARNATAKITIADGVHLNNAAVIIAERCHVAIGKNTLIGTEFTLYDSDFHHLAPQLRSSGEANAASVVIGENVFIGSRVTVLKGVIIGNNSVIASGSVVTNSIPENCIAAGVPAKVIRNSLPH